MEIRHSPSVLVFARIVVGLLTLTYVLVLARELGPAGRGVTAAIFATSAVLPSILGMGLPLAVRRQTKNGRADESFSSAIRLLILASPISVPAGVLVGLLFRPYLSAQELWVTLALLGLSPLIVVMRLTQQILLGKENYLKQAISLVSLSLGIAVSVNFFFIFSTVTVFTALISQCVGLAFSLSLGLYLSKPRWKKTTPWPLFIEARGYWPRDGLRELRERADQIIVLPLLGPVSAGIYSVALLIAMLPDVIASAIGIMVFHKIRTKRQAKSAEVTSHIRVGLAASIASALPLMALSPWLIPLVFGGDFEESILLAVVMLITITPIWSMIAVLENVLNSLGREKLMSSGEALILLVAGLISVGLAPVFGLFAVVTGFAVGGFAGVLSWILKLKVSPSEWKPAAGDWQVFRSLWQKPPKGPDQ